LKIAVFDYSSINKSVNIHLLQISPEQKITVEIAKEYQKQVED
jgi:hypothetical protein